MGRLKWYKRDPDAALGGMFQLGLEERAPDLLLHRREVDGRRVGVGRGSTQPAACARSANPPGTIRSAIPPCRRCWPALARQGGDAVRPPGPRRSP